MKLSSPNSEGLTDEEFEEYKSLTTESLNERKVLKVATPQTEIPNNNINDFTPNMGGTPEDDMQGMDFNMPEQGDNANQSEFDTNFDAGVEADEDEDPKKYIQQLTGKLSQELGKYNNELETPDVELSKYVGGMIVKQVAKTLDEPGRKELIKKIKTSETNDEANEPSEEMGDEENFSNESYKLNKKGIKQIFEIFNASMEDDDEKKQSSNKIEKGAKKKKPFVAPSFK